MTPGRLFLLITAGWLFLAAIFVVAFDDWRSHWGSTAEEAVMTLPGDSLIPQPVVTTTRAITVHAPPEKIWPWLLQMGQRRGAFYTHTAFQNLAGLKMENAWRIVPEWQRRRVGDLVYLAPGDDAVMAIGELHPDSALVLITADPETHLPVFPVKRAPWTFSWAFTLHPGPVSGSTRLVVRERVWTPDGKGNPVAEKSMGLLAWIMESGTLRGIKIRAEQRHGRSLQVP